MSMRPRATLLVSGLTAVLLLVPLWPAVSQEAPVGILHEVGAETFEPTIGAAPDGSLYYALANEPGVAIGWSPGIARSTDGGESWTEVTPQVAGEKMPPETNDPYIYVDPGTGRAFQFHMSPILTCSVMSWTDDGGQDWDTNPVGCGPTGVWDHQSIVAAEPRTVTTNGYPRVLVQCVNAIYAAMCSQSLDGGSTWLPSRPAYENRNIEDTCGAQHGHLASGPDGTIYLPTSHCGTAPTVYVSQDDGVTWRESTISTIDTPFVDPSVSVDSENNVYATFIDESGWLYFSVSRDGAETWSAPVRVADGVTTNMPVIVAGDPGRVSISYPGTDDLPDGYATDEYPTAPRSDASSNHWRDRAVWDGYFSLSANALDDVPTFTTLTVNGDDPLVRGAACVAATRCDYFIDFLEQVTTPTGQPYAAFVDGCTETCATTEGAQNDRDTGDAVVGKVEGFDLCAETCWQFVGATPQVVSPTTLLPVPDPWLLRKTGHEALSPDMRRLQRKAIRQRLDAMPG